MISIYSALKYLCTFYVVVKTLRVACFLRVNYVKKITLVKHLSAH